MTALSPHLRQATPVVAARGEGVHLFDQDGRRHDLGVAVAGAGDADAGGEVEVAAAVLAVEMDAFASDRHDGRGLAKVRRQCGHVRLPAVVSWSVRPLRFSSGIPSIPAVQERDNA